jgi:hypothetical protein
MLDVFALGYLKLLKILGVAIAGVPLKGSEYGHSLTSARRNCALTGLQKFADNGHLFEQKTLRHWLTS